jgi:hypothetical protein
MFGILTSSALSLIELITHIADDVITRGIAKQNLTILQYPDALLHNNTNDSVFDNIFSILNSKLCAILKTLFSSSIFSVIIFIINIIKFNNNYKFI